MSLFSRLKRLLNINSVQDTVRGLTQREQQQRIDVHKLCLYTSFYQHQHQHPGQPPPPDLAQNLISKVSSWTYEEQAAAVQQVLEQQALSIARACDDALQQAGDPRPAAAALQQLVAEQAMREAWQQRLADGKMAGTGLTAWGAGSAVSAHGPAASSEGPDDDVSNSTTAAHSHNSSSSQPQLKPLLTQQQLSQALQERLGFTLRVDHSSIQHQEAGLGLYLHGSCPAGALVALFPGLVYPKADHRHLPGYPLVGRGNPYLTSRWDGSAVDSLPWGRGWRAPDVPPPAAAATGATATSMPAAAADVTWPTLGRGSASSEQHQDIPGPATPLPAAATAATAAVGGGLHWVQQTSPAAAQLELLEGRHPLALAHIANHPGPDMMPNVMIASFTVDFTAALQDQEVAALRPYLPNMSYRQQVERPELLKEEVPCVGLVALEPLAGGTELLFNYRLSPGLLGRPAWYVSVDEQEEERRWA